MIYKIKRLYDSIKNIYNIYYISQLLNVVKIQGHPTKGIVKEIKVSNSIKRDGGKGVCGKEGTCSGNEISGKCPGPSNFKCCTSGKPIKPDAPKPHGSGAKIDSTARSMTGKYAYSRGGGNLNGASHGSIQPKYRKCDDRKVVGFDCSGLSLYAVYQGTGVKLSHSAIFNCSAKKENCSNWTS